MKSFIVAIVDCDQTWKPISVCNDEAEADTLVRVLELKCSDAVGMDYYEIMDFVNANGLNFTKADIRDISKYGSYLTVVEVPYNRTIDYSIFNFGWEETQYDWYTSDNDFLPCLDDDYNFDYNYGCNFNVDLSNIKGDSLKKWSTESNKFKNYDSKEIHPDVAYRLAYYDPIHKFAANKGFRNAEKKICKLIRSHTKHGGTTASNLVYKIKSCSEYKHNHTFRKAAEHYINALEQPYGFSWMTNWEWCMPDYVYNDGFVMNKHDARKYWGYSEICEFCLKDHGA